LASSAFCAALPDASTKPDSAILASGAAFKALTASPTAFFAATSNSLLPTENNTLTGFVDASGSAAQNAELAKQRALAVRDALQAAGIDAQRIELRKPENITAGTGADAAQARRVDIAAR
jgi:cytochrome c oxidase subunit II